MKGSLALDIRLGVGGPRRLLGVEVGGCLLRRRRRRRKQDERRGDQHRPREGAAARPARTPAH
jgi:hypothetical protein